MTFLGLQAGRVFTRIRASSSASPRKGFAAWDAAVSARLVRWVTWGLLTGAIGGSLCGFTQDGVRAPAFATSALHCLLYCARVALCASLRAALPLL